MLHVAACKAERGCGAAALLKVIVASSFDFCDDDCVFILPIVIFTRSKCNFLLIKLIFSGLSQC